MLSIVLFEEPLYLLHRFFYKKKFSHYLARICLFFLFFLLLFSFQGLLCNIDIKTCGWKACCFHWAFGTTHSGLEFSVSKFKFVCKHLGLLLLGY